MTGPRMPARTVLLATVTSVACTPPIAPPWSALLVNRTRWAGSCLLMPEIDTATAGVSCSRTFESIVMSVGAVRPVSTLPVGSKSMHESPLGGDISM